MKQLIYIVLVCAVSSCISQEYSERDLRFGSITTERAWWDVKHYKLDVKVFPEERRIKGTNTITYTVLRDQDRMQIDLQKPMKLDYAEQNGKALKVSSEGMFHFIEFDSNQKIGDTYTVTIAFSGKPKVAKNPPWDGGFTWKKDSNGKHFIATSNQGIGSSIWWPNKDHPYDEPDNGVELSITVPSGLIPVGNGRLIETLDSHEETTFTWRVTNPINNYGVNINIGDYVNYTETIDGEAGELHVQYFVLRENYEKAKKQFKQVPMTLEAFEHWFGPYPFYEDSFKLVEVPYLGMEHQSSVTYGNGYQNGYRGTDLSGSGWGMKFDFIIVHETGHEWFANNITNRDVADMWIHEGFTAYSENLYLDYHFGTKASSEYVIGTRRNILNDIPIIGNYNVRHSGSSIDKYYKGANILHTLRQLLEDDSKWREILRGLNETFRHQTVTTGQVEDYISEKTGIDLTEFWQQYLRTTMVPKVEYRIEGNLLKFRYVDIIEKFDMPVILLINGAEQWIYPKADWQEYEHTAPIDSVSVKKDFYVNAENTGK